jgi:uncharacterized protein YcfJ
MKKLIPLAIASLGALAVPLAASAESFGDSARVISTRAVHEQIPVAREECWNEQQRGYQERRVTRSDTGASIGAGTVLGAVVGGVIGHQFGGSSGGRDRATAAGAIVGGLVGNQVERDQDGAPERTVEVERVPVDRNVQRCRTVNEVRDALVGYDVRYEYRGRQFATRLPNDPGPSLALRVEVRPQGEFQPAPPPEPVYVEPRPRRYR